MDVSFWQAIVDADFVVPDGLTVSDLTPQLVNLLGSANSQMRDDFGFAILAVWIDRGGYYSPHQLRELGAQLVHNLTIGIGETETDSVFQRAFSALILGKVIDADNRETFLGAAEVHGWLDQALTYVHAERDVRGFVPEKGWAHAIAHMGDLLMYLARNRRVGASQLERILEAIGTRMSEPVPYVYRALEDERMAYAAIVALQRELLTPTFLRAWVDRLAQRWSGEQWSNVFTSDESANAYYNTRQFLRSLYFQLLLGIRAPFWYTDPTPFEHIPSVRDLMCIGGGLMGAGHTPAEEETLFYRAYGQTQIDPIALAYYRYERIVQDIAVYCEQLLSTDEGGQDRERSLRYLKSNFLPNSTIDIAYQSDMTLCCSSPNRGWSSHRQDGYSCQA